jgi:hypothetical protein
MARPHQKAVLLIGNGPNQLGGVSSWKKLLDNLRKFVGAEEGVYDKYKPFPLLYEELFLKGTEKNFLLQEEDIKKFICDEAKLLQPNSIHQRLAKLGFGDILTTNYDHTLELTERSVIKKRANHEDADEKRYSLYRNCSIEGDVSTTKIWHIHGDQDVPESITLGYAQYSGYLQKMYAYTTKWDDRKGEHLDSLVSRLKAKPLNRDESFDNMSWLDFFFTRNVYILGLALDFVEIHLWWLLTFRARAPIRSELNLGNQIFYLFWENDTEVGSNNYQAKLSMLKVARVATIPFQATNWEDYYDKAVGWIKDACCGHE